ncbi:MAG: hypothetical protein ABIG44_06495 [Planctomycetota bacterium]
MQCWSCHFENLPGLEQCARCGGALSLEHVAVVPPRALRWRIANHAARIGHYLHRNLRGLAAMIRRLRFLMPEPLSGRALLWSIVPGLGHLRTRRPRLGWILLLSWSGLLLMALLSVGTVWTPTFVSLSITVHAIAILAVLAANLAFIHLIIRLLFGILVYVILYMGLYQPTGWLCGRYLRAVPIQNILGSPVLADSDGLLVAGPWLCPEIFDYGDIVLYRIHEHNANGVIIHAGHGIDRVIGRPGDHLCVVDGELCVNGGPPVAQPFNPVTYPPEFDIHLPEHTYLIMPSQIDMRVGLGYNNPTSIWQLVGLDLILVTQEDIEGRVLLRIRPLARFGRLH